MSSFAQREIYTLPMSSFGKFVASTVCAAQIVGGCSTSSVSQQPETAAVPTATVEIGHSWTNGTRPSREVTVQVSVSGDKDRILSGDGQGSLVIREEMSSWNGFQTGPIARLSYQNDRPGIYSMPAGVYSIRMIATGYECQPVSFFVPTPSDELAGIVVVIDISVTGDEGKMTVVRPGASASDRLVSESYPHLENERSVRWCGPDHASGQTDELPLGGKIALGILMAPLLVLAAPLVLRDLGTYSK